MESTSRRRDMKDFEIVFIFGDGKDALCLPDVNDSIGNHACIAAGVSTTKRVCMINKELTIETLDNKPRFVRRQDGASAPNRIMLGNLLCGCVSSWTHTVWKLSKGVCRF